MNDDKFDLALKLYFEKAKEWCAAASTEKRKTFNQWHKDLATKTLTEQIKTHFKKWNPTQPIQ